MSAYGIVVLVAIGSVSLLPLWVSIGHLWATDPLRSIGVIFPFVSLIGVVSAWRRLGWNLSGSFWGLLLVALSLFLGHILADSKVDVSIGRHHLGISFPGPVLFLYGVGATMLFGGERLLRAAIGPLCLLLCINPVPRSFNVAVDLPLQELSASTARSFSHLIGLHPTGDQLRMMFAPNFGMLIVPGCNGVRGSITLAYLVLIFGYSRRLRLRTLGLMTLTAGLLGYGLNLLRLCVLVLYYRAGLRIPSIQPYGVEVDYAIGCSLFLVTTLGLGLLIRFLQPSLPPQDAELEQSYSMDSPSPFSVRRSVAFRIVCFVALVMVLIVPASRSLTVMPSLRLDEKEVLGMLPVSVGPYRLIRSYSEHDGNGTVVLVFGEYDASESTRTANRLTFGMWVGSGNHLVANSKAVQGSRPDWTGSFEGTALHSLPVHFANSFYDDGVVREFNAEAGCSDTGCGDYVVDFGKGRLLLTGPSPEALMFSSTTKRLPIVLHRDWPDSDSAQFSNLRTQFESDALVFTQYLDILPLLKLVSSKP